MTSREEFLVRLRKTFKIEAAEGISRITANVIKLEKNPDESVKSELIESTYREAHSLKGAARAVNVHEIETICQSLENIFSALKENKLKLDSGLFDLFHLSVDLINDLLNGMDGVIDQILKDRVNDLVSSLFRIEIGEEAVPVPIPVPEPDHFKQSSREPDPVTEAKPVSVVSDPTVRISLEKIDNLFYQAEEMLVLKQTLVHLTERLNTTAKRLEAWSHEASEVAPIINEMVREPEQIHSPGSHPCNEKNVQRVVRFFDWASSLLKTTEDDITGMRKLTLEESYQTQMKIESLLDDVKEIISVPFSTILGVFPKAARDISKDIGKNVVVDIRGAEMEIDRRILEELQNPLMHLLRNCIDHGIESPQTRKLKGKPETGTVLIVIDRLENNRAEITFSDDGAGIDVEKARQKYAASMKISEEESKDTSEQMLIDFLFNSGVSTSEMITDLSGRGLGLAIVKEKIEQLGGSVTVKSIKNLGVEFKIDIPLSLVSFSGVQIRIEEREFVVPASKIERVLRLEKSEVKTIDKKANIDYLEGIIPLVYLSDLLEIPSKEKENNFVLVFVTGTPENRIGFAFDEILDADVILVKKFNDQLKRVRNISGATVLGSGKVVPILNVSDLLKSAVKDSSHRRGEKTLGNAVEKRTIMVVEDSITSRMLLKNILETSGYKVFTAIDGIEGYSMLKENPVDLVVSDIDMPRMSGLDMTAKIRSDKSLSAIPVVLVTSLSRREDRERGLEVGANAYIVKSNFDQSDLLEVVERLIKN